MELYHIQFLFVVLCFLISLKSKEALLITAMLLTVCADYCLIISGWYTVGVAVFCAVQAAYIIRHTRKARWLRFLPLAVLPALVVYFLTKDLLISIAVVYAQLLLLSVFAAFLYRKFLIILGMLLFLLCDICVALYNLGTPVSNLAFGLIWVFYAPSQMLLATSSKPE